MAESQNILMPMEQEGSKSVVRAWLKQIGDTVQADEPIVELETDKVAVEVPAPADGVLSAITLDAGADAPPGAVLGVLTLGVAAVSGPPAPSPASMVAAGEG
ncbi:MAG TPA: dihydrolipoamide succinyltransferase, partial [Terricaulis sp.]|nr:dihydrolipoamide succinyltransferase [Terricaulis sp.]